MPNCTEKPTAPKAMTEPVAMPDPIDSMIRCMGRLLDDAAGTP